MASDEKSNDIYPAIIPIRLWRLGNLEELLDERALKTSEVASSAGVARSTVRRAAKSGSRRTTCVRIAAALGMSISERRNGRVHHERNGSIQVVWLVDKLGEELDEEPYFQQEVEFIETAPSSFKLLTAATREAQEKMVQVTAVLRTATRDYNNLSRSELQEIDVELADLIAMIEGCISMMEKYRSLHRQLAEDTVTTWGRVSKRLTDVAIAGSVAALVKLLEIL